MIGLGSNRLTVCRRGGMSVTQAGRGGMEWLGVRGPSWASPYSAQATAALLAQFPTQWPTIRDYGFAHPEIVGYMNAYAPEDAKIAYSLVAGLGIRWLVGDGYAFINTDVPINGTTYANYLWRIKTSLAWRSGQWTTQGVGGGSVCTTGMGISASDKWAYADGITDIQGDSAAGYEETPIIQELDFANRTFKVTDLQGNAIETKTNITVRQPTGTGYNILFGWRNYSKSAKYIHASKDAEAYLRAGDLERHYIPFKLGRARAAEECYPQGAQAVGTLGMLDLVTGLFHPNANSSGSFTESIETPAS